MDDPVDNTYQMPQQTKRMRGMSVKPEVAGLTRCLFEVATFVDSTRGCSRPVLEINRRDLYHRRRRGPFLGVM